MNSDRNFTVQSLNFLLEGKDAALQIIHWTEVNEGKKPGVILIFEDTNLCWHLFPQSHLVRKGLRPRRGATELFDVSVVKKLFLKSAGCLKIKNGMHRSYIPFDLASA